MRNDARHNQTDASSLPQNENTRAARRFGSRRANEALAPRSRALASTSRQRGLARNNTATRALHPPRTRRRRRSAGCGRASLEAAFPPLPALPLHICAAWVRVDTRLKGRPTGHALPNQGLCVFKTHPARLRIYLPMTFQRCTVSH